MSGGGAENPILPVHESGTPYCDGHDLPVEAFCQAAALAFGDGSATFCGHPPNGHPFGLMLSLLRRIILSPSWLTSCELLYPLHSIR